MLAGRLQNRRSPYACVFAALIEASSRKPDAKSVDTALKDAAGEVSSFDDLDKSWEEQNAFENSRQTTGQDMDGGCPKAEEMLAHMKPHPDAMNKEV